MMAIMNNQYPFSSSSFSGRDPFDIAIERIIFPNNNNQTIDLQQKQQQQQQQQLQRQQQHYQPQQEQQQVDFALCSFLTETADAIPKEVPNPRTTATVPSLSCATGAVPITINIPEIQKSNITPEIMREAFINAIDDCGVEQQQVPSLQQHHERKNDDKIIPQKYDVVCGRDKFSHAHVGNKRFRVVIEMNRHRYQTATTRDVKTKITNDIVKVIQSCQCIAHGRHGGRFLKLDVKSNVWFQVGDEFAREKVSHALRSAKDPALKKPRRKKRKSIELTPPTKEENEVFYKLLQDQQRIFQLLVEQEDGNDDDNNNNDDDDDEGVHRHQAKRRKSEQALSFRHFPAEEAQLQQSRERRSSCMARLATL